MRLARASALSCLLLFAACNGGGGGGGSSGANAQPFFTSAVNVSVQENLAGAFYTATATDADGDTLTFSISGGADAALFTINAQSGALSFARAPDFELPGDADGDNVYALTLGVSDGRLSATLTLRVTVTDNTGPLTTRRVATGFLSPLFLTAAGSGGRVFVVERAGRVRLLEPRTGDIAATPFLDISTQTTTDGERGLLGLAPAPDFATSGVFYVHLTNPSGDTEIRRYRTFANDLTRADPASGDVILTVAQPASNHNGGWIGFDANGLLYIALGDGGGGGDPFGNGQNPNTLLGAILRIDPASDAFPNDPNRDYAIPPGNPFVGGGGAPEIWLWGLRNPYRASFDRDTGNLYIGDVGQNAVEEIDLARPQDGGANFGWNILEGTQVFAGGSTAGLTPPIAEYPQGTGPLQGRSVTGGYVYRGPVAALRGHYVFGDFVNRRAWSIPVSAIAQGATLANTQFNDRTASFTPDAGAIGNIASFGEDARGNLYIVDFDGEIFIVTEDD